MIQLLGEYLYDWNLRTEELEIDYMILVSEMICNDFHEDITMFVILP